MEGERRGGNGKGGDMGGKRSGRKGELGKGGP